MAESTSQLFYAAAEPQRDRLWSMALTRAKEPAGAEGLVRKTLQAAFASFAQKNGSLPDLAELMVAEAGGEAEEAVGLELTAMPAAVWARAWGAVHLDASKLGGAKNLREDSVLLKSDPLLAPKKKARSADDFSDVVPKSRVFVVGGLLLILGIVVVLYVTTRPSGAAATAPAGAAR